MFVVSLATATAHTRGSVAKPPADFKHVIASVLGQKSIRKQWTRFMTGLAMSYRNQGKHKSKKSGRPCCCVCVSVLTITHLRPVLMDYSCFKSHVNEMFGDSPSTP